MRAKNTIFMCTLHSQSVWTDTAPINCFASMHSAHTRRDRLPIQPLPIKCIAKRIERKDTEILGVYELKERKVLCV